MYNVKRIIAQRGMVVINGGIYKFASENACRIVQVCNNEINNKEIRLSACLYIHMYTSVVVTNTSAL